MRVHLSACLLGTLLLASQGAWAAFSSIYVFGDSLSDNGTAADAFGIDYQPPYSSIPALDINRVSNGPVAVEVLAGQLGLPLEPSLIGSTPVPAAGTNYAIAGARAGGTGLADLASQIDVFGFNHLFGAPSDALYVMFIGGNDVLDISATIDDAVAGAAISTATAAVGAALDDLIGAGAQSILVPNVIDIGLTPAVAGNPALATQRSMEYNASLATTLAGVESNWGINLFEYDLFSLSQSIVADPFSFGLTNVTDPCTNGNVLFPVYLNGCDAGLIDQFAFIDDIHPTATVHEIIGNAFVSAIPVPAALPLFASGLLVMIIGVRRRR